VVDWIHPPDLFYAMTGPFGRGIYNHR